ncbi:MAG TPA: hypothetical protein VKG26_00945 [Bacteroidia bacterium]|nr:hypothetical protein [Bacteroidia bacterium]
MDTEKKIPDAFEDTKKLINALSEEKLNNYDKDELIEISLGLADELKKVFREMKRLTVEKEKLKAKVEELGTPKQPVTKYEGYPRNKDYIAKLLFILSKNETDMTFEDIVKAFYLMESDLDERWRNPNKSISKIISRACNFQVVMRKKAYGNSGYYIYGMP